MGLLFACCGWVEAPLFYPYLSRSLALTDGALAVVDSSQCGSMEGLGLALLVQQLS